MALNAIQLTEEKAAVFCLVIYLSGHSERGGRFYMRQNQ